MKPFVRLGLSPLPVAVVVGTAATRASTASRSWIAISGESVYSTVPARRTFRRAEVTLPTSQISCKVLRHLRHADSHVRRVRSRIFRLQRCRAQYAVSARSPGKAEAETCASGRATALFALFPGRAGLQPRRSSRERIVGFSPEVQKPPPLSGALYLSNRMEC
jgi:hypothetical protein